MKKICIISALHLSANPRVWKEANSLAKAGYKVVILTIITSANKRKEDTQFLTTEKLEYKAAINLVENNGSRLVPYLYRIQVKVARWIKRFLHIDSPTLLGYSPKTMLSEAIKENADLYIAHVEYGFHVGKQLVERNKNVAFDFEDWYSQDYLIPTRPVELLTQLENFALTNGSFCTCPSQSMANALKEKYNSNKDVAVIYNGFSIKENVLKDNLTDSLVWFSQTIGEGRGLETLIESLHLVDTPVQLHLIGNCVKGYDTYLKSIFPYAKKHDLVIHPPVPHSDLVPMLAQFKIGLAIENDYPGNKNTTVSNKILQYLQAGIKVLATDTMGQSEVAKHFPGNVSLVAVNNTQAWAEAIERLLASPLTDKEKQLQIFEEKFSWEAQEKKLLKLVEAALD